MSTKKPEAASETRPIVSEDLHLRHSGIGSDSDLLSLLAKSDELDEPVPAKYRPVAQEALYPNPKLLAEYKALDPTIYEEIVSGVRAQREHRQSLEKFATTETIKRQNRAELTQNVCSLGSILVAGSLVFAQIWFKQDIQWIFPSILIAVGVGGRPVATLIASRFVGSRHDAK